MAWYTLNVSNQKLTENKPNLAYLIKWLKKYCQGLSSGISTHASPINISLILKYGLKVCLRILSWHQEFLT